MKYCNDSIYLFIGARCSKLLTCIIIIVVIIITIVITIIIRAQRNIVGA
uniref:Uncharacterized protein n=1 Tax=Anguilla anguilla TaxID=7936 RepID=A0A0E9R9V8_ANGAN